jgi:hypothetical protein
MTDRTIERIELDPLPLTEVTATIEGITPLVVNNFGEKAQTIIEEGQTGKKTKGKTKRIRDTDENFIESLYFMDKKGYGEPTGFPATGLKKAMASAAYRYMGFKDKVSVFGVLWIPRELVQIEAEFPEKFRAYVRNSGAGRTADLRYRGRYEEWSMRVPIRFNHEFLSLRQVASMLAYAGFSVGIGEWRPEKNGGDWGRFEVKGIEGGIDE